MLTSFVLRDNESRTNQGHLNLKVTSGMAALIISCQNDETVVGARDAAIVSLLFSIGLHREEGAYLAYNSKPFIIMGPFWHDFEPTFSVSAHAQ
jgi:hypothetical protein